MNKAQKEVIQAQLNAEKKVIRELKQVYGQALKDVEENLRKLSMRADLEPQNIQTIIYQQRYQEVLKAQLEGVLEKLHTNEFNTVSDYLNQCYYDGYIGTMYDLQAQGIPLVMPIDQEQVTQAIQLDSKLSKGLYTRLGEDVKQLKTTVRAEISRGIANGSSWNDMAVKIAMGMRHTPFQKAMNRAVTIARTEGHRIQAASALDAQHKAKDAGADVLKQWDSTLDGNTRDTHRMLDGQLREVDEDFEVAGKAASAPGHFGDPAEDCNCRCILTQRARWELDEKEFNTLKERAAYFGLDKSKDFEDFREKYLKLPENADKIKIEILSKPTGSDNPTYNAFFDTLNNKLKVAYNTVENHKNKMTSDDIIQALSGGDLTSGSCASLGLAYIGQKQGWNVLELRGGESQIFFSGTYNLKALFECQGIKNIRAKGACTATVGKNLLKQCEAGKEYYLYVGRHAAIVRKTDGDKLQYLELQSPTQNGWHDFDGNVRYTLVNRFGCSSQSNKWSQEIHGMIDIADSNFNTDDFRQLLGYINTADSEQKKGKYGTTK